MLAGEEGAVVGAQGEALHPAVFENVVVDDAGDGVGGDPTRRQTA